MLSKILRLILSIIGILFGVGIVAIIDGFGFLDFINIDYTYIYILFGIIFGLLLFFLTPKLKKLGEKISDNFETELLKFQTNDIILGAVGLVIGLIIAFLISQPLYNLDISYLGTAASVLVYLFFGYLGINVATRKKDEISISLGSRFSIGSSNKNKKNSTIIQKKKYSLYC